MDERKLASYGNRRSNQGLRTLPRGRVTAAGGREDGTGHIQVEFSGTLATYWRHNALDGLPWFSWVGGVEAEIKSGEVLVVLARLSKLLGLGAMLTLASGAAQAENLDAGKSAAALFSSSCATCHSSPRGLAKDRGSSGLTSFLEEHYTSGPQSAAALAAYLIANPGNPRGKQAPAGRAAATPAEGAEKRGEAKTERQTSPPQTTTMRPDSMIEPVEPRRPDKGRGKRQPAKQETPAAPAVSGAEPAAAPAAAPAAPAAAPVAPAPPPPDQSAFSAPSP